MKTPRETMDRLLELARERAQGNPQGIQSAMDYFDTMLAAALTGLLSSGLTGGDQVMQNACRYAFELTCARFKLRAHPSENGVDR